MGRCLKAEADNLQSGLGIPSFADHIMMVMMWTVRKTLLYQRL